MMTKKEKSFGSAKEIIKTYFPTQTGKSPTEKRVDNDSTAEILIEKLATEFGTSLRKGMQR